MFGHQKFMKYSAYLIHVYMQNILAYMFGLTTYLPNMFLRVHLVQIPHAATSAKKKRFPVNKCDRGVFSSLCHDTIEIWNWDCPAKIYTGLDMYIFLKSWQNSMPSTMVTMYNLAKGHSPHHNNGSYCWEGEVCDKMDNNQWSNAPSNPLQQEGKW